MLHFLISQSLNDIISFRGIKKNSQNETLKGLFDAQAEKGLHINCVNRKYQP